ncbi:hypothetical protein J0A67_04665 [Algoriphagus aestuariicola]|uniref:Uncharacterized protein n=1 Tax=Algoriphagus aestuariicola TaxID=1852016 RepID=A0ABS3BLH2_9BACT|nr:hypothetical protein [Algoriphagus aestuariicola]MBN7800140.1 hypothetical protein [Algoriphagus aestuariicola]
MAFLPHPSFQPHPNPLLEEREFEQWQTWRSSSPVCVARWYLTPVLVTNTLLTDCAEAETDAKRRMEIRRNRNAGIIGGINRLQSGGREVGF